MSSETRPIILSAHQKRVYDTVYSLTGRGRNAWIGILTVDGLPESTVRNALGTMKALGVLNVEDVPQYRFRRFEIKVCPHRIASGSYKDVMRSRMDGADKSPWASDTKRIRDDGKFGDEWRARNMPDFEDDPRLPATLTRYAKAPPRPDARSL